jgi:hypothetical protein
LLHGDDLNRKAPRRLGERRANGGAAKLRQRWRVEARWDQLAHAPALHPAFYRAIHPVAVIRRVRALVAVYQDGDCPEEFPAVVRSVCPALPVEFPEARSASCFAPAGSSQAITGRTLRCSGREKPGSATVTRYMGTSGGWGREWVDLPCSRPTLR